jgi:amidophosphoribosyltransferase
MSTRNEFIASGRVEEEIAAEIGADGVIYQSLENLQNSVMEGNSEITQTCHACFSGEYPTGDVDADQLQAIENERQMTASTERRLT